ncbi:MAG: flagellar basal body rod C-terminal domain-containing protein, partial [Candidatus Eisenbacteria bacterium]|nr:flagellar basal body rod C-terminal domain-containing protein [Candidatus Eisenbacteria bacterium]
SSAASDVYKRQYVDFAAAVGTDASNASQDQSIHDTLLANAETMRSSVSGVSIDEEMTLLIGQQQAYTAAARLITAADEMMQELLRVV